MKKQKGNLVEIKTTISVEAYNRAKESGFRFNQIFYSGLEAIERNPHILTRIGQTEKRMEEAEEDIRYLTRRVYTLEGGK